TCKGEANANVQSFSWQEERANVIAGNNININATAVDNSHANLVAKNNISITTPGDLTNTSGTIHALNGDVNLTAGHIVNQVQAPVSTHVSYGSTDPIGGCNPGGTYKDSHCSADFLNAAGDPSLIQAGHDLTVTGSSLSNIGSAIDAGNNANLHLSGDILNQTVSLTEQWRGQWVEETDWFHPDKTHTTYGTIVTGTQDAVIHAGNNLTGNATTITNSGKLTGKQISLSSTDLINGLTDKTLPTAQTTVPQPVISLAPVAIKTSPVKPTLASATDPKTGIAAVVGHANAQDALAAIGPTKDGSATVTQTAAATAPSITYLKHNAADDLLASIGPASLVANLPSNLLPQTGMQFYADPYLEQQLLTQAALKQTGQAWFINGLAQDDKTKMSLADEQKAILYQNAIAWADKNQVTLGTALTDQQIAALDAPMLWYVQQAVPDPSCAGLPTCGTVSVLMPQVYLPTASQSQLAKQEGGLIQGQTVTLTADTVTNTGSIIANQLDLKAKELVNEARSVDIGYATNKVEGGWINVYGTQVQPGGLISATNLNIDASTVHSIGGQFQVLNADGTVDEAKSAQLIADLAKKLGVNYTSQTVADDIHQDFMKDTSGPGAVGQVVAVIAAIAIAYFVGPLALEAMGSAFGTGAAAVAGAQAVGGSLVAAAVAAPSVASVAAAAAAAGLTAITSAAASQLITTGRLDGNELLKAGAVGALTAGITSGLADSGMLTSSSTWGGQVANAAERAVINTTVQTAIYGGSFQTSLVNNLAGTESAVGANFIGSEFAQTDFNQLNQNTPNPLQVLAHAALGCATASLQGTGCSNGAIGGATSAIAAPVLGSVIDTSTTTGKFALEATDVAITGAVANAAGKDVSTALSAAQNEVENNYLPHALRKIRDIAQTACNAGDTASCPAAQHLNQLDASIDTAMTKAANSCFGEGCAALNNALNATIGMEQANLAADVNKVGGCSSVMLSCTSPVSQLKSQLQQVTIADDQSTINKLNSIAQISQMNLDRGYEKPLINQSADALMWASVLTKPVQMFGTAVNSALGAATDATVAKLTPEALGWTTNAAATATVDRAVIGLQWGAGIKGQGMPWEDYLETQLPAGSRLPPNFKTFDFFDQETGIATSAKTLDTTTPAKIANPSQVYSSLKGNIDAVVKFKDATLAGRELSEADIAVRELQVAVPKGTTAAQWEQINKAIQYGQSKKVIVKITEVAP
uniref:endonuclease toxin domain-containing protein n=1 Tax=Andreprevotia chitinilytica TaxID=396808 RepID=UPI001B80C585